MNYIDYIIMAVFFAALILIPAISSFRAKSKGSSEYFKSTGSMPWWLIGVSMVAATTSTNSANLFKRTIRAKCCFVNQYAFGKINLVD